MKLQTVNFFYYVENCTHCYFTRLNLKKWGHSNFAFQQFLAKLVQWTLDLRETDLRKKLDLRKIVDTTDFLVHKLFDLRKIFQGLMFDLRKKN